MKKFSTPNPEKLLGKSVEKSYHTHSCRKGVMVCIPPTADPYYPLDWYKFWEPLRAPFYMRAAVGVKMK